jgi:hypothetical protein
MSTAK